ncbi:hypothetical protein ABPG74_008888 [Tetrahymena malaccensis]
MAELNQIPEITEISINDIFDIYSTGDTVITKSLGYGSLGPVFQASKKCDDVSQNVVIKSFSCTQALYDQIAKQVNQTEVFQNSQNVLKFQVKKVAENGDHVATAFEMELCQKSLQQYISEIKEGKANPTKSEVLVYFIQALNGLLELQESGYQHHNLKSSNILISEDDTIKISDSSFNLELSQKIYNKPQQYNRFLSINYLSPEYTSLIDGKGEVEISMSSDVFSLGVIFLELIGQEINIVSAIKLKSGIFEGVQVKEGFQDLASFVCENMLCYLPQDRKAIPWLIEAFSEQFFNEVTQFRLDTKTSNNEQVLSKEEDQVQNIEVAEKQNILVECDNEAKNESEDESNEVASPLKNSFNDNEYEILENDQEAEIVNNHQASAKKQDENEHESQESTLDQEAIQAQNQNQENEITNQQEQENTVQCEQAVEQNNIVDDANNYKSVEQTQNQEAEQIPLVNLDDQTIKKQIARIQRMRIDLSKKELGNQQIVTLFQRLEAFTSLTHLTLDLSNNQLDDNKVNVLSQFLSKCNNLIDLTLILQNNNLTPLSLTFLNNALSRLNNMTKFQLSIGSQLLSEQIEKTWEIETISLINVIKQWSSLVCLNVSLGQLKVSEMLLSSLVSYLTDYTSLKELRLEFGFQSEITEEIWNKFAQFVQGQENLSKCTLPTYEIKQELVEETIETSVNQVENNQLNDQEVQVDQDNLATQSEVESNLQTEQLNEKQETKTEEEFVDLQAVETEAENTQQDEKQEQADENNEKEEPATQQTEEIQQNSQELSSEKEDLNNLNTEDQENKDQLTEDTQDLKQIEEQANNQDVQETAISEQNETHDNQAEQDQKYEQLQDETKIQNEINESSEQQVSSQKDIQEENNEAEEEVQENSDKEVSE